jgi:hypothetical protein
LDSWSQLGRQCKESAHAWQCGPFPLSGVWCAALRGCPYTTECLIGSEMQ